MIFKQANFKAAPL